MWWKIYFVALFLYFLYDWFGLFTSYHAITLATISSIAINFLILLGIFIYTFSSKKLFDALIWKIIFWVCIADLVITFITFNIAAINAHIPGHSTSQVLIVSSLLILLAGLIFYLPGIILLYRLGYRKNLGNTTKEINMPTKTTQNLSIWQTDAFIVLLLILFWPIGLILMWKYALWRRSVKTLLTIFFSSSIVLPMLVYLISAVFYSNQVQTRNSFGPLLSSSPNSQALEESKVYNFEPLGNGYTRVTSQKYKLTFDFPSDLQFFPPLGKGQPGGSESIGFQTQKRIKNNPNSEFVIIFSLITNSDNICQGYKSLSNWKSTTVSGLPAVEAIENSNINTQIIILCNGTLNYEFIYEGAYSPKNENALTPTELVQEKVAFYHMLDTFKLLP